VLDYKPATDVFLGDVLKGLRASPRSLPCKYFYDEHGSQLFDRICELDEYYLTRSELAIMEAHASEMAEQIGRGVMLVEYGSGSSVKTRLLLDALSDPVAYVPVDISREHLRGTAKRLARAYPYVEVLPVCADFTKSFALPRATRKPTHSAVYFPGSTIGNFSPPAAQRLLEQISGLCGSGGGLLIGIDLQKDAATIEAAYNDAAGVTAQFNLNLLHRINRELKADFAVDQFTHAAQYNVSQGRVEISLVSRDEQVVEVGGERFGFRRGEEICTEYCYKYTVAGFADLADAAGLQLRRHWTDDRKLFGVLHLVVG